MVDDRKTFLKFDGAISVPTLLLAGSMFTSGIFAYSDIKFRVQSLEAYRAETSIRTQERDQQISERLRATENQMAKVSVILEGQQRSLDRIEGKIEKAIHSDQGE